MRVGEAVRCRCRHFLMKNKRAKKKKKTPLGRWTFSQQDCVEYTGMNRDNSRDVKYNLYMNNMTTMRK